MAQILKNIEREVREAYQGRIQELEEAILHPSPRPKVTYIDVSDMSPKEARETVERVRARKAQMKIEWVLLAESEVSSTSGANVPGGVLVKTLEWDNTGTATALVFLREARVITTPDGAELVGGAVFDHLSTEPSPDREIR